MRVFTLAGYFLRDFLDAVVGDDGDLLRLACKRGSKVIRRATSLAGGKAFLYKTRKAHSIVHEKSQNFNHMSSCSWTEAFLSGLADLAFWRQVIVHYYSLAVPEQRREMALRSLGEGAGGDTTARVWAQRIALLKGWCNLILVSAHILKEAWGPWLGSAAFLLVVQGEISFIKGGKTIGPGDLVFLNPGERCSLDKIFKRRRGGDFLLVVGGLVEPPGAACERWLTVAGSPVLVEWMNQPFPAEADQLARSLPVVPPPGRREYLPEQIPIDPPDVTFDYNRCGSVPRGINQSHASSRSFAHSMDDGVKRLIERRQVARQTSNGRQRQLYTLEDILVWKEGISMTVSDFYVSAPRVIQASHSRNLRKYRGVIKAEAPENGWLYVLDHPAGPEVGDGLFAGDIIEPFTYLGSLMTPLRMSLAEVEARDLCGHSLTVPHRTWWEKELGYHADKTDSSCSRSIAAWSFRSRQTSICRRRGVRFT
jgi:hypothetical protein